MVDERETTTSTSTTTTTTTTTTTSTEETTTTSKQTTQLPGTATGTTTTVVSSVQGGTAIQTVTLVTNVLISKRDTHSTEVAGATLTLTGKDADGNDIVFDLENVELGEGAELISETNGTEIKFKSGTAPTNFKNLVDGKYILHEEAAPDGYEVTTDIRFEIEDAIVYGDTLSDGTVVMTDTKKGEVAISKKNVFSEEIPGATLTLTGKDSKGNAIVFDITEFVPGTGAKLITTENGTELTWTSGTTSSLVKNLPSGTYVLEEEAAPSGYVVTTDIEFTIEDGVVTGETNVTGNTVTMIDDMKETSVNISKKNVFDEELPGATLTLTGTDFTGREVIFDIEDVELGTGAKLVSTENGKEITFISGTTDTLIKGLNDGTYTLTEEAAPNGYLVTTAITFTIEDGVVTGTEVTSSTVTMIDEMVVTDIAISKKNTVGDEIEGAQLTITGKDSRGENVVFDIEKVELGTGAKLVSTENGTELTWTSGTTATLVKGLPDGTYTLHEDAAPSGYVVATDITFTIENGKVTGEVGVEGTTITMIDDMVVTTTSTTTTSTTTTTTTTTTTATSTTTATTTGSKTSNPKTGVAGAGIPLAVIITAAGVAFAVRRKREDEE